MAYNEFTYMYMCIHKLYMYTVIMASKFSCISCNTCLISVQGILMTCVVVLYK